LTLRISKKGKPNLHIHDLNIKYIFDNIYDSLP
jgi:hypothetical protein